MTLAELVDEFKKTQIIKALEASDQNVNVTAALLGISRKTLWDLRLRYDLPMQKPGRKPNPARGAR